MKDFGLDLQNWERFRLAIEVTRDGFWEWDIPTYQSFHFSRWSEILDTQKDTL